MTSLPLGTDKPTLTPDLPRVRNICNTYYICCQSRPNWSVFAPACTATDMGTSAVFSLPAVRDLNRRCIDLMAQAAHRKTEHPLSIICTVRTDLCASTPASRERAADRAFLLLDLEFGNALWWRAIVHDPERQIRKPSLHPAFPRYAALPLTRATLIAAWRAVCADAYSAEILLGLDATVAELLINLPVTSIDHIARHIHPHLRPRWADHPAFWRALLRAANREDGRQLSRIDVQGIQLLTGDMLIASADQKAHLRTQSRGHRRLARPTPA